MHLRDGYVSATSSGPESPTRRSKEETRAFVLANKSKENLEKFHKARPRNLPGQMLRLTSWADPVSAAAEDEDSTPKMQREESYTAQIPPPNKGVPDSMSLYDFNQVVKENRRELLPRQLFDIKVHHQISLICSIDGIVLLENSCRI